MKERSSSIINPKPQQTSSSRKRKNDSTPLAPPPHGGDGVTIGASVIPIVNKLQDILAPLGSEELSKIPLPHVAVVGSQSSGKSSVLESLVGRDFLPRGKDICTRRPLILQLEHCTYGDGDEREWGEFLHLPNRKFFDFSHIRREIQAETDREAGKNKGVSDKPIRLKICSPNVVNITLIDLPGITKVPVGDQPRDIEARIRKMIMTHIKQENCIILAVSPANSDLATSDAIQMAEEADPTGSRTIGVITKLDIMDKGTDARDFLLGKVIPLRLGYVGVINRSQADIKCNKSVGEALNYEEKFFTDHPAYHDIRNYCGIPQLSKKLNQILEKHIRTTLPSLKSQINSHFRAVEEEIRTYGDSLELQEKKETLVLDILRNYCEAYSTVIDGKDPDMSTKMLVGGARLYYLFQSVFIKALEEVDPCEGLHDEDIRIAIRNSMGPYNELFIPEVPFKVLIRKQIERLEEPSLQCLQYACDELMKMSHSCESRELLRFPALRKHLGELTMNFLHDAMKPAEERIVDTIMIEADVINTSHPNFVGGQGAIEIAKQRLKMSDVSATSMPSPANTSYLRSLYFGNNLSNTFEGFVGVDQRPPLHGEQIDQAMNKGTKNQAENDRSASADTTTKLWGVPLKACPNPSSNGSSHSFIDLTTIQLEKPGAILRPPKARTEGEKVEVMVTKILLQSYFNVVRKKIEDEVPRVIMHFLVNHLKRDLHNTFIRKIYREGSFEELLQEDMEIMKKRKRASEMFHMLKQAVQTLDEVESNICPSTSATAYHSSSGPSLQNSSSRSSFTTFKSRRLNYY